VLPRAARAGLLRGVVTGAKVVVLTGARVTKPRKVGTKLIPPKARIGETILGTILGKKVHRHYRNQSVHDIPISFMLLFLFLPSETFLRWASDIKFYSPDIKFTIANHKH
jgi:hypothetical protein